jgi:osmotically-inducible protein OsmY
MSTRYGDRGFGRYGDSDEDRTEDRDFDGRDTGRAYGDATERYGRGSDYGSARRGGYAAAREDYRSERDYGPREQNARDYFPREYGPRYGSREYGAGEHPPRYGREGGAGGYAGSPVRRHEGEDYGRAYGRDVSRDYGRARTRVVHDDDDGVRDYDTDYGRTTSRFYGRSGYEYGREDYDRDDDRGEHGGRAYAERDGRNWLDRAADGVRSWFGGDDDGPEGRGRGDKMHTHGGRAEGKFRGRGPRNYRRSDERVREELCDRLTDNEWLDASDVEVNVVAGEAILTGTVDSRYAKRLAETIAESVSGVTNVQNSLRVHNYQAAADTTLTAATPAATASDVAGLTDAPAASAPDPIDPDAPTPRPSTRAAGRS